MIRVLHIQQTIGSGGVERRRLSLAKYLDKDKFQLKIACTDFIGDFHQKFEDENVELLPVGVLRHPFDLKIHRRIQKIIDEYKPHILHGAVFEGVTMAAFNGFLKRVPIVIIEETSDPENTRSWKANVLMMLFARLSDKAIGV